VFRRGSPQASVTDLVGTAAGGLLYLNGYPEDAPNVPAGKLAYKQLSLAVSLAAMSVITTRARGRTGWQTVSMQEAVMLTTVQTANENYWHWHRTIPQRRGIAGLGGRSIYQAADGLWLSFTIPPPYWGAYTVWLAEVTGRTEFQSEQWRDRHHQIAHVDEINKATEALCAALPRAHLVEEGQRRHLLVLPVNDVAGLAADPHLRERGFFTPVWHPQFERMLTMPASAMLSSAFEAVKAPAPTLGQHTEAALRDLAGLTDDEIAALVESRIALTAPTLREVVHG
jgi:crotonobetainyl-CoA:carnitine CoA-transferase CaiB-like acyl-CoA transferase